MLGCLLNKALAALITMGLSLLWMMMLLWYRDVLVSVDGVLLSVDGVLVSVGGVLLLVDWVVCFLFWMGAVCFRDWRKIGARESRGSCLNGSWPWSMCGKFSSDKI